MTDDAELEAQIRARDAAVTYAYPGIIIGCQGDRRTLLRLLDEVRAELAHRDTLDEFTKPLSCEFHGLVPNLASFGNACPNCQMMGIASQCTNLAARLAKAEEKVERLRVSLQGLADKFAIRAATNEVPAINDISLIRAVELLAALSPAPPSETP